MDEKRIGLSFQEVNHFTAHAAHQAHVKASSPNAAPNANPGSVKESMAYEDCEAKMGVQDSEPDDDGSGMDDGSDLMRAIMGGQ